MIFEEGGLEASCRRKCGGSNGDAGNPILSRAAWLRLGWANAR
jgi:hypothetical protein